MTEKSAKIVNEGNSQGAQSDDIVLLRCPIRGDLTTPALAKDGLTATEEARRIDFIEYLLDRGYPPDYIAVETVVLRGLGESGRNSLRADVIVYDLARDEAASLETDARLERAVLVGEIKRDSAKKPKGITCQLEPAMRQLPGMRVLGAYWDDINRILFTKELVERDGDTVLEIHQDALANLPDFGAPYREKAITVDTLTEAGDLVRVLQTIANVMRSHGVNDEHLRYKETVKLLLARYCDEKEARATGNGRLDLQVLPGSDPGFLSRVTAVYQTAARRYSRAQSLFTPIATSELDEPTQREIIVAIQGMDLSSASNESLQQVFMSFVPAVFKKSLDQYFTPPTLIDCMVAMTQPGPNDKIADPAMGTGDFLTAGMEYRTRRGDDDVVQRVYGVDSDQKAYDLAVINMILNKDGQSNLVHCL